jgi:hypothetical protein
MALQEIDQILKRAYKLTPSERLLLANRLIQGVRSDVNTSARKRRIRRKWRDAIGLLPYPALGIDAQLYISRSRSEDGLQRVRVIRDGR